VWYTSVFHFITVESGAKHHQANKQTFYYLYYGIVYMYVFFSSL